MSQDRQVSHTNDVTYGEERHKQDARGAQYRFVDFVLHFLRLYDLEQDAALSFRKAAWTLARQFFLYPAAGLEGPSSNQVSSLH